MTTYKLSELQFKVGELVRFKPGLSIQKVFRHPLLVIKKGGVLHYRVLCLGKNKELGCMGHEIERL